MQHHKIQRCSGFFQAKMIWFISSKIFWSAKDISNCTECVWRCMWQFCGCRRMRRIEYGVGQESGGGGGRYSLTLSRHKAPLFKCAMPHETPGWLWRTSRELSLINQKKVHGEWGEGSCRGQRERLRELEREPCIAVLFSNVQHKILQGCNVHLWLQLLYI